MKVAYVAGPYTADTIHGVVQNIRNAEAVAVELWKMGYAVICPHKNTALFDGICEDSVWLEGDLKILKRCDILVLAKGWRSSKGACKEVKIAIEYHIPAYCWETERDNIP